MKKSNISIVIIIFHFNFIIVTCNVEKVANVNAATIAAASCSQIDVQNAINSAEDGDVVIVPMGECTWTGTISLEGRSITVMGAGIDKTIITDATGTSWGQTPFWITGVEGKPFRITGFTFLFKISDSYGAIFVKGTCKNWRIDNCKFEDRNYSGRGIWIQDYTEGVIDNCIFINCSQGIAVKGDGDKAWERPLTLGTEKAVYVEDCIFNFNVIDDDAAIDGYHGARYVFRYNTLNNTSIVHHGFDSGGYRSTHSYEIYENNINPNGWTCMCFRGGTGVVFNNTCTNNNPVYSVKFCALANYRSCQSYPDWGKCDGSNPYDGNSGLHGYPCRDQIGRTTHQRLEPVFEWNNFLNGKDANMEVHGCSLAHEHIQENRDYYNNTPRPGYLPYTYPHPLTTHSNQPANLRIVHEP